MTIVKLKLRHDAYDDNGQLVLAHAEDVDLDQLSPRARALAEAVAQMPGGDKATGEVLCRHSTLTRRDTTAHPEVWLRPEGMDQPARQAWSAWDKYPAHSTTSATSYLERQARKIPHEWVIVSAQWITGPQQQPVPSSAVSAEDPDLTRDQVLDYMRKRGRDISVSTWSSYAARGQAPGPDRRIGRTPLWRVETIDAFLAGTWRAA